MAQPSPFCLSAHPENSGQPKVFLIGPAPARMTSAPKPCIWSIFWATAFAQTSLIQEDDTPGSGKTVNAQNSLIAGFLPMSAPLICLETILCKLYSLRGMFLDLGENK